MRVQLLRGNDPGWEACLRPARRDIHHTAGYHRYAHDSGEGEPFLVIAGDDRRGLAWPYLLRRVADADGLEGVAGVDATSVYGYPGPVGWGCAPGDGFLADAWREVLDTWRQQGVVTAFTRFNPLLENASLCAGFRAPGSDDEDAPPVVAIGPTLSIDLSQSEDAARASYPDAVRRQLRSFRRAGLATFHDQDWSRLPAFARLYQETMARNDAPAYYRFGLGDFERLRAAMKDHAHLLVTHLDGVVGAAGLVLEFQGIATLHLVGTSQALAPMSPYKLLVDDALSWARDRGNSVLHLGGGRGAREDSLYEFKRRFASRRHVFAVGRWVLDGAAYRELVRIRAAGAGRGAAVDPDYFPAYRAPALPAEPEPAGSR